MPQRKPNTDPQIRKAQRELEDALRKARNGHYMSALSLACRRFVLQGETRSAQLRIWEVQIMVDIERFFEWLEAVQMAYQSKGVMTGGYSICVQDAILYWHERKPDHPYWAERWRAFAEMPEFDCWAEDINRQMQANRRNLDPANSIA